MNLRLYLLIPICLTILVLAWLFAAAVQDARLRIAVEGGYYQMEPAWIRVRVSVDPDAANRGLLVAAISDGFETSSYEQLEGTASPLTRWKTFKDVPAGTYALIARVDRGHALTWYARTSVTVIGR